VRYLIISDLHANLHALDAVLADAKTVGYDATLVLGDLVGYGADPSAVIARTLALEPAAIVRGNHDKVAAGIESAELFNDIARRSIEWTAQQLSPAELTTLSDLPKGPCQLTSTFELCHGAPFDEDYYIFDADDASRAIGAAKSRICFFGHTHLPALFATGDDPVRASEDGAEDELALPTSGPALINIGSVGQPRDGDPRAAYGVLDVTRHTLRLRRVTYDIAGAQARIIKAGLPEWLALRLERGQ
jgi:diadenosine tetraphosphatase ApaH/serine/threonine PP2A family protein phosphatase